MERNRRRTWKNVTFWFFVVPTDVDEFDAVVGDGVEGDGDVCILRS